MELLASKPPQPGEQKLCPKARLWLLTNHSSSMLVSESSTPFFTTEPTWLLSQTCDTQDPWHMSQHSWASHGPGYLPPRIQRTLTSLCPGPACPNPAQKTSLRWLGPQSTLQWAPVASSSQDHWLDPSPPSHAPVQQPLCPPHVPPGPHHLSSPGSTPPSLAPTAPPALSPLPCQWGSRGSSQEGRERCHPILEAPVGLRREPRPAPEPLLAVLPSAGLPKHCRDHQGPGGRFPVVPGPLPCVCSFPMPATLWAMPTSTEPLTTVFSGGDRLVYICP